MTKLGSLLGRKPTLVVAKSAIRTAAPDVDDAGGEAIKTTENAPPQGSVLELDQELFFPIVSQLGEENEAVRNLLIDAEHKISELEIIKRSIGRLVEPVSKTLRAFEEAKSEKLTLQSVLNSTRVAHAKLREDLAAAHKRAETLDAECTRLREVLTVAQQSLSALESTKSEQSAELAARRSQIAELQRQLREQATELQLTREENLRAGERTVVAEQRMLALEAEASAAQQKFQMSDRERAAVQAMLDKALNEAAQLSRRVLDSDKALTAVQARLRQTEAALHEAQSDRERLTGALDETNEQLRSTGITHQAKIEAMQARVAVSDRLLEEARRTLAARAEELAAYDRRVAEAVQTRDAIESKFGQVERALAERDAQIEELEQSHVAIAEHARALEHAVDTREAAYGRSQEKIAAQENLIQILEGELRATREEAELQAEEMKAQLQREQLERRMAEGALEAGRKDIARLLRELAALQGGTGGAVSHEAVEAALMRFRSAA